MKRQCLLISLVLLVVSVTAAAAADLTCPFGWQTYSWQLNLSRAGSGTIAALNPPFACPPVCTVCLPASVVTLTAVPADGYHFAGWAGDCTGTAPCTVGGVLAQTKNVSARFVANPKYALTVTRQGSGAGNVHSTNVAGIDCGTDCTESYNAGTVVTLLAEAAAGSVFFAWSGCSANGATCSVTMNAAHTVYASFVPGNELRVIRNGTGTGTVTSSPAGITCGSSCSKIFPSVTSVTLHPQADTGSVFAGWSGSCSGTGDCTLSMSAARTATATFNLVVASYRLDVVKYGAGSGTITSENHAIDCGSICSASFDAGTGVTLRAQEASGSVFDGWSGACSGSAYVCNVAMSSAKTVGATFSPASASTYQLSVVRAGAGTGTITSNPAGINCGTICAQQFSSGTTVTLSATPAAGAIFSGWSGACSGTGSCTVSMTASRAVTALFDVTSAACAPTPTSLCLSNNRFRVEVNWTDFNGNHGSGRVVQSSSDSGIFWFFAPANWELMVKVLNACSAPYYRFWVYSAATTNVQYTLTVTDTLTGQVKQYTNPLGVASAAITDSDAFATCP